MQTPAGPTQASMTHQAMAGQLHAIAGELGQLATQLEQVAAGNPGAAAAALNPLIQRLRALIS